MNASNTEVFIIPAISLTRVWVDSQRLWVTHPDFPPCLTYRLYVDGVDVAGESLLLGEESPGPPNPWSFTTECPAFAITLTDPRDNQTGVTVAGRTPGGDGQQIIVWFSRAADPATFRITLDPPVPLTPVWSAGNGSVTLRHDDDWFVDCALHTVTVSASDTSGNPLTNITGSKPNPWTFTTVCIPPQIAWTDPANGTTGVGWGVPIVVTFTKPMDTVTVNWSFSPDLGFLFAPNWTQGDRILTLAHVPLFPDSISITVTIVGNDPNGLSLIPGTVPNPWYFTTATTPAAPAGLHVARTPLDVRLTWDEVAGATSYAIYRSPDRFAAWPWPKLTEVPTNVYVDRGAGADGVTHYYIVRAKRTAAGPSVESGNSTMGVKASLTFAYDDRRTNVYWMSLPYRTMYRKAGDISGELTSSRIDVLGKWDPETQSTVLWYFFRGGWRGTDFALNPGDGFFVGILQRFEWVVNGTDGAVVHAFSYVPPPNANVHWISLPYTAAHARASDIVLTIEGGLSGMNSTKIIEVARWDPIRQWFETFAWAPSGWSGTDFPLVVGEGLYLLVVSSFEWTPRLLTAEVP